MINGVFVAIVRLGTAKQSPNTLFKVDANTNSAVRRSRRFSLTGSHAKKAAGTRNVSSTTLEAKLIAGMHTILHPIAYIMITFQFCLWMVCCVF